MCQSVSDIIWIYLFNFWFTNFVVVHHLIHFVLMPFCDYVHWFESEFPSLEGMIGPKTQRLFPFSISSNRFLSMKRKLHIIHLDDETNNFVLFNLFLFFVCRDSLTFSDLLFIINGFNLNSVRLDFRLKSTPFSLSTHFSCVGCVWFLFFFCSLALVMPILCLQFSFLCVYSKQKDLLIYNLKANEKKRISNLENDVNWRQWAYLLAYRCCRCCRRCRRCRGYCRLRHISIIIQTTFIYVLCTFLDYRLKTGYSRPTGYYSSHTIQFSNYCLRFVLSCLFMNVYYYYELRTTSLSFEIIVGPPVESIFNE